MDTRMPGRRQRGFTLMVALFALTIFGLGLAAFGESWSRHRQREKEDQLLRIGHDVVAAIEHYYRASPGAAKAYPKAMAELIEDKRFVGHVHHLREVYADPMSGTSDWGIVEAPDGGIAGIFSRSNTAPLRRVKVDIGNASLAAAERYSDWKFSYIPDAMGNNGTDHDADPAASRPHNEGH